MGRMMTGALAGLLTVSALGLTACTNTQAGTVAGTAAGAVIGYQVGDSREERQRNAVIGGVAGGAAGYYVGDQMDQVKYCPKCGATYTSEASYCPVDGTPLELRQQQ